MALAEDGLGQNIRDIRNWSALPAIFSLAENLLSSEISQLEVFREEAEAASASKAFCGALALYILVTSERDFGAQIRTEN